MKKQLLTVVAGVFVLAAMAPVNGDKTGMEVSNERTENIAFNLIVNESAYGTLQRRAGERGITGEEFGRWIDENVQASQYVDDDDEPVQMVELHVLKFDANGQIIQEQAINVRVEERASSLRTGNIAAVLGRFFPGDLLFPGDTLFPGEMLFPGDLLFAVDKFDGAKRTFQQNAQQLMQRASAGMDNPAGIGLILLPVESELKPETSVKPGGFLFIKNTATS